jgi:hypothetical protein
MLKNFAKSTAPLFQDILHADGSKTYDTVYGMIKVDRPYVVQLVEDFLLGKIKDKMVYYDIYLKNKLITFEEVEKIMRIID